MGRPGSSSCSFPKAMKLPVTVRAPNSTSKPRAAILAEPMAVSWWYSTTPTSVAARAPNRCEIAMRWGMAVMGTITPSGMPMTVPTTRPPMIQS
jgi:hypothetical protein